MIRPPIVQIRMFPYMVRVNLPVEQTTLGAVRYARTAGHALSKVNYNRYAYHDSRPITRINIKR